MTKKDREHIDSLRKEIERLSAQVGALTQAVESLQRNTGLRVVPVVVPMDDPIGIPWQRKVWCDDRTAGSLTFSDFVKSFGQRKVWSDDRTAGATE